MGTSTGARPARIDDEVHRINKTFLAAHSQMKKAIIEAGVFTAFMHDDPRGEFDQVDRDKYSNMFTAALMAPEGLYGTLPLLQPLNDLETGAITKEQFIAQETGYDATTYSKQFD